MRQHPQLPGKNLPQAIIDLASLLKDPEWLASTVQAAKDINDANKLTEDEIAELDAANRTIADAAEATKLLNDKLKKYDDDKAALEANQRALGLREQQADSRDKAQAAFDKTLKDAQARQDAAQVKFTVDLKNLSDAVDAVKAREDAVKAREDAVTERENTFKKASGMLANAG